MKDTERIARSNRAAEFLKSSFWIDNLKPWIDEQERRLKDDYFGLPNTEKFHAKREDMKSRCIGCTMIQDILNTWKNDRDLIQRSKELKKADEAMMGGR